jgi:two-component system response regulator RegA
MTAAKAPVRLLLVDDDDTFRERLALAMSRRGYAVQTARHAEDALNQARDFRPEAAVIDLKMPGPSGLVAVQKLRESFPRARLVVLTGYGSIATALEAVRLGADHYLTKPADANQIEAVLRGPPAPEPAKISAPSLDRVEWEHIQRVLGDCQQNISQAARLLGIDRRSLQRKLAKHPPPQ